jgi:hypothetical protein
MTHRQARHASVQRAAGSGLAGEQPSSGLAWRAMTQAGGLGDFGSNASIDRLLLLLSSLSGESKRRGISAAIKAVLAQQEVGPVRRGLLTRVPPAAAYVAPPAQRGCRPTAACARGRPCRARPGRSRAACRAAMRPPVPATARLALRARGCGCRRPTCCPTSTRAWTRTRGVSGSYRPSGATGTRRTRRRCRSCTSTPRAWASRRACPAPARAPRP